MTDPTKPVAWVSAAELERVSEFGFVHAEITQRSRTDKVPLYTAAQLQAVRLEGVKAGIEAAAKSCENSAHFYSGYNLGSAALETEAAVIRELQPETVMKEYGK